MSHANTRSTSSQSGPGAARHDVQISRPLEFGSQQNIRGPDSIKTLVQLREEQGEDFNPLRRRRDSSIARAWRAVKRSMSMSRTRGSNEQCETRPRSERRRSMAEVVFGMPQRRDEDRGRRRRRRDSRDASRPRPHSHHGSSRKRRSSPRPGRSEKPEATSHSHASKTIKSGKPSKPGHSLEVDTRKAFGAPYDEDLSSDWWWDSQDGRWRRTNPPGSGTVRYEDMSDRQYEKSTSRKRGVFPSQSPRSTRQSTEGSRPKHDLNKAIHFDEESGTYRHMDVQDNRSLRRVKQTLSSSSRRSMYGTIDYAESTSTTSTNSLPKSSKEAEGLSQQRSAPPKTPFTPWPSGFDSPTPQPAKTSSRKRSADHGYGKASSNDRETSRERRQRQRPDPIKVPDVSSRNAQAIRPPPASSVYPEDEAWKQATHDSKPPVPSIPAQWGEAYLRQQGRPPLPSKEAANHKPTPYTNLRDDADWHRIQQSMDTSQQRSTAGVHRAPAHAGDLDPANPYILTADNPFASALPSKPKRVRGRTNLQASLWETDTALHLTSMPKLQIPGLSPIQQSTVEDDVKRLSLKAGCSPTGWEVTPRGPGPARPRFSSMVEASAGGRGRKVDTVCGIIDAYGEDAVEQTASVRTRWDYQ